MLCLLLRAKGRSLLGKQWLPRTLPLTANITRMRDLKDPEKILTMAEVRFEIMRRLGLEQVYQPVPKTREHLLKYHPKAKDLPARSMQDSFSKTIIPLRTDRLLQDFYVSHLGSVRHGRMMEDMDMFAVWVCHQHIKVPQLASDVHLPYTFVTILVDKVTFSNIITTINEDVIISGHVSWVGSTSIEVSVWLDQKVEGTLKTITGATFLMAARNATNTGSAPVNRIEPANEEEKRILLGGEDRKKRRHQIQTQSVLKLEPTDFEQTLMYELYKRTTPADSMTLNKRQLPPNCRWMNEWKLSTTIPSFPENRNAHNTVFGGFIMRQALENSWTCAYLYCGARPKLVHLSDISFEKPVRVSSFIHLASYPVYTQLNYVQIITVVDVLEVSSGATVTSNAFYSTYSAQSILPEVMPLTYHETTWYIHGRRKFENALAKTQD